MGTYEIIHTYTFQKITALKEFQFDATMMVPISSAGY